MQKTLTGSTTSIMSAIMSAILLLAFGSPCVAAQPQAPAARQIDQYSYRLGILKTFAGTVGTRVKTLALGPELLPEDTDAIMQDALRIAQEERVEIYREPDLLVTDLFPAAITVGKHVLLIYKDKATLDAYLALKQRKAKLVQADAYSGKARDEIARAFGEILSYPEADIVRLTAATRNAPENTDKAKAPTRAAAHRPAPGPRQIDLYSYRLGIVKTLAELVDLGVKTLALGPPMLPEEMDAIVSDAHRVAKEWRAEIYREPDLLVTDLLSPTFAAGKHVLLIHRSPTTIDAYLALKQRKVQLVQANRYSGKVREEIAREFGKLMSYPDSAVNSMLNESLP